MPQHANWNPERFRVQTGLRVLGRLKQIEPARYLLFLFLGSFWLASHWREPNLYMGLAVIAMFSLFSGRSSMQTISKTEIGSLRAQLGRGCPVAMRLTRDGSVTGSDYGLAHVHDGLVKFEGRQTAFRVSTGDCLKPPQPPDTYVNTLVAGSVLLELESGQKITLSPLDEQSVDPEEAERFRKDVRNWLRAPEEVAEDYRLLPPIGPQSRGKNHFLYRFALRR